MALLLDKELELYGCDWKAVDFNDLLIDLHTVMHPSWSTEELLYEPDQSKVYCDAVRARAGKGLPNRMILRRLQNVRKRGDAPTTSRPKKRKP